MRRSFTVLIAAAACTVWAAGSASAASTWAIQATPNPGSATGPALLGVSCPSANSCFAVGTDTNSNLNDQVTQMLAEHWNGSSWAIQAAPVPSGAAESELDAVSCTSASNCMAVGSLTGTTTYIAGIAEHWNGKTWTVENVINPNGANPSGDTADELDDVSCVSAMSCTAVGFNNVGDKALAEHWNGSSWTIQSTPSITNGPEFDAISCVSATSCTAVGDSASATSTLAEQWNGSSWSVQSTPNVTGAATNLFDAIACVSATSCTAVGNTDNTTLAERS